MKSYDILEALNEIDDYCIKNAKKPTEKSYAVLKWVSAAAAFCLILSVTLFAMSLIQNRYNTSSSTPYDPHAHDTEIGSHIIGDDPAEEWLPTENDPPSDITFYEYEKFLMHAYDITPGDYTLNESMIVDVKKLFDLDNNASSVQREIIDITSYNEFTYYALSEEAKSREEAEYCIFVKFNEEGRQREYHRSVVKLDRISDMANRDGIFLYQTDDLDVLYYKDASKHLSIEVVSEKQSTRFVFSQNGMTQDEIASAYGDTPGKLASGSVRKINSALDDFSKKLSIGEKKTPWISWTTAVICILSIFSVSVITVYAVKKIKRITQDIVS